MGFKNKLLVLIATIVILTCSACESGVLRDITEQLDSQVQNTTNEVSGLLDNIPFSPSTSENDTVSEAIPDNSADDIFQLDDEIPAYTGDPYCTVNSNTPYFDDSDMTTEPFETYTELDSLGRCGTAYANICVDLMPTEERGDIGQIKPTGWHTIEYDIVSGKYLYNRCHLIGYQLAGENANEKNLITGTRYMNVEGMLPFENMVADYVQETENHVLYRVTPIFEGDNLVSSGVLMEALSVEDSGGGVCFNVFVYNVQPGITIDYATGDSWES